MIINKTYSTLGSIPLSKALFLSLSPLGESPRRGIEVWRGQGERSDFKKNKK